jgi:hypothetical protein
MQKTEFFTNIIFCCITFKVSAWISNHAVCKIGLTEFYEQQNLKRPVHGKNNKRKLSQYLATLIFCAI